MYQRTATPAVSPSLRGGKRDEIGRKSDGEMSAEFGSICAKGGVGRCVVFCDGNGE